MGAKQWSGVCVSVDGKSVTVYRTFSSKFKIKEQGVTEAVLASDEFEEMQKVAYGLEKVLSSKNMPFLKSNPQYTDFRTLNENFKFTR